RAPIFLLKVKSSLLLFLIVHSVRHYTYEMDNRSYENRSLGNRARTGIERLIKGWETNVHQTISEECGTGSEFAAVRSGFVPSGANSVACPNILHSIWTEEYGDRPTESLKVQLPNKCRCDS